MKLLGPHSRPLYVADRIAHLLTRDRREPDTVDAPWWRVVYRALATPGPIHPNSVLAARPGILLFFPPDAVCGCEGVMLFVNLVVRGLGLTKHQLVTLLIKSLGGRARDFRLPGILAGAMADRGLDVRPVFSALKAVRYPDDPANEVIFRSIRSISSLRVWGVPIPSPEPVNVDCVSIDSHNV